MRFFNLVLVTVAALTVPTYACKCIVNGEQDTPRTQSCCDALGGTFQDGNDCQADSISDGLSIFDNCCGGVSTTSGSDCDCPDC
ncbi:hypothetical protein N7533_009714 [Penicillium manginii]|uniref:uncharacterized protein n=1 Tax=Penicillium manginii TaxID=203109 RepID=UPI0025474C3E|nr:uncharacterized protein N7533_009714 [Penicillium manginii]KAJ5744844.1 hypothetical protein N7533_009714 [Penicillium manginii]